ncbi:MAG: hypothetical protein D6812_00845 [Deltaproteobacteria bacterium]|nr:MAG: hypothetical protein D6812_00845 [Deltaproteobacteria bacterium]
MSSRKIPYPWGRKSPRKRAEEIDEIIERHRRQKRIVQSQFEDAMRRLEKNIEVLEDQKKVVESYANEERWDRLKARIYELALSDDTVLEMFDGLSIDEAERRIEELGQEHGDRASEVSDEEYGDDLLMSGLDSWDALFKEEDE